MHLDSSIGLLHIIQYKFKTIPIDKINQLLIALKHSIIGYFLLSATLRILDIACLRYTSLDIYNPLIELIKSFDSFFILCKEVLVEVT